jgi:glycosyltransferase involved in cell wall biosynthesis
MRIAVLRPQVPFARGGVEIFTDELVAELRARGHEADLLSVPFKWYPGARGLDGRVRFEGRVSPDRLAELYATCTAVFYAPVDEDFGMGPYEAFLSGKPVITTTDSGGPLDVVHDRETGLVVAPEPQAVARAASWLREHEAEAEAFGRAGKALADEVTWDRAIARLLS